MSGRGGPPASVASPGGISARSSAVTHDSLPGWPVYLPTVSLSTPLLTNGRKFLFIWGRASGPGPHQEPRDTVLRAGKIESRGTVEVKCGHPVQNSPQIVE